MAFYDFLYLFLGCSGLQELAGLEPTPDHDPRHEKIISAQRK